LSAACSVYSRVFACTGGIFVPGEPKTKKSRRNVRLTTAGFLGVDFVHEQLTPRHGDADDPFLYALLLLSCFTRYHMGEERLISPTGKGCYAASARAVFVSDPNKCKCCLRYRC
jgi:hypothetical protein